MQIFKRNILSVSRFFIKLLIISVLGFLLLYKLTDILFDDIGSNFLPILIPSIIAILFVIVCLIVSEVFRFIHSGIVGEIRNYNSKTIFYILFKCFIIILAGFTLAVLYKVRLSDNKETFDILFYISDLLLVIYSLLGVIKGEQLRELNYRKLETENQLLKSKINPHFLYNTLNNIDSLIWIDQEKASDSIIKLSSLMRYMTYKAQKTYVLLTEEVTHVSDYLELQRLRYDNPAAISFCTNIRNEKEIYITPMILMPFVENAFKHCDDKSSDNAINIIINADRNYLIFRMENNCSHKPFVNNDGGFGLSGVKRRLKLMYNKQYNLKISQNNNRFIVELRIDFINSDII